MKRLQYGIGILLIISLFACNKKYKTYGDVTLTVFNNDSVQFVPEKYTNAEADTNGIIHLTDGRILLKKVTIPQFERSAKVSIKITLTSAGDRWDKSGSCFVLPKKSAINLLNVIKGQRQFPEFKQDSTTYAGVVLGEQYFPTLELMRFMTPFGVGFYSDTTDNAHRKPVYIPKWEKEVVWEQDITHLLSELEGETYIGVWVDTWTREGYQVTVNLKIDESDLAFDKKTKTEVLPLINTVAYMSPISNANLFYKQDVTCSFEFPANAINPKLYYITTGHGGHSGGDEFVKKQNIVTVDGKKVIDFIPWRDDCASFRRFNPTSGTWLVKDSASYINWEKRKYEVKEIEERIASSDYSRSNWCPGSDVPPVEVALTELSVGTHTITFSIPEAQQSINNELNHWLVSSYIVWEVK